MRATIGEILQQHDGLALVEQALNEGLAVASAAGQALPAEVVESSRRFLLDRQSKWASSMARDLLQGAKRLESQNILGDLIEQAQGLGLEVPLLRTALCHLRVHEAQFGRPAATGVRP